MTNSQTETPAEHIFAGVKFYYAMQYIPTNLKINLEWSVKKGIGNEAEDFSRSTVSLFLFSDENRWAVPCTADYTGVVRAEIPETLPEGVYSLDLLWIKNEDSIQGTRCLQRTRKTHVFAIDASASPHQTRAGQPVTVKMTTVAAPYGYDGLSAYEAAILYGMQINISEKEWAEILYNYEASEQARVEAEQEREQNEGIRQGNESARNASELLREGQEATRQSNENARQTAEQSRATQEDARQESEQSRAEAEEAREQNEAIRQENESGRNATESTRNMSEGVRQAQEEAREQNEATRQAQEEARQARVVQTTGEDASLVMSQAAVTRELTELDYQVDGLKTQVDGLETQVDGLETQVDGLETQVDGLETELGYIKINETNLTGTLLQRAHVNFKAGYSYTIKGTWERERDETQLYFIILDRNNNKPKEINLPTSIDLVFSLASDATDVDVYLVTTYGHSLNVNIEITIDGLETQVDGLKNQVDAIRNMEALVEPGYFGINEAMRYTINPGNYYWSGNVSFNKTKVFESISILAKSNAVNVEIAIIDENKLEVVESITRNILANIPLVIFADDFQFNFNETDRTIGIYVRYAPGRVLYFDIDNLNLGGKSINGDNLSEGIDISTNYTFAFLYTYTIEEYSSDIVKQVLQNKEEIAKLMGYNQSGGAIIASDLQSAINDNRYIMLLPKVYDITTSVDIPSNTTIIGTKGTEFHLAGGATLIALNSAKENILIDNITFRGTTRKSAEVITLSDAINLVGKTNEVGILIGTGKPNNFQLRNCQFYDFGGAAIKALYTHPTFESIAATSKITDCVFMNNYIGLEFDLQAEYYSITGCSFSDNVIGIWNLGGNNIYANIHADSNSVGAIVTKGENDGHGSFVGCSFNHNKSFSIIFNGVQQGYSLTGCQFFQNPIWFNKANGIIMSGCMISAPFYSNDEPNAFAPNTQYTEGDLVTYNGYIHICLQNHLSGETPNIGVSFRRLRNSVLNSMFFLGSYDCGIFVGDFSHLFMTNNRDLLDNPNYNLSNINNQNN